MSRLLAIALLAAAAAAGPADPSVGICLERRKFEERQEVTDAKVVELITAKLPATRKRLAAALAKAADKDIECLIRYRESYVAPVFVEALGTSRKWSVRARAAYGLKMTGDAEAVPALAAALDDAVGLVREAAAGALGHLGGDAAKEALAKRRGAEKDPYVLATIESALELAAADGKPYGALVREETLEGPLAARRVAWREPAKGAGSFDRFAGDPVEVPVAERFVYPVQRYKEDLFAGYPRKSFGVKDHAGEDCAWFREGSSIYAVADGVVRVAQDGGAEWGHLVVVEHRLPGGRYLTSVYGHCASDLLVAPGAVVRCGQRIATLGLSCSDENGGRGAHLHFGLRDGPARCPPHSFVGHLISWNPGGGAMRQTPIVALTYSVSQRNSRGWPLTAMVVREPGGAEVALDTPERPLREELNWIRLEARDGRGWLDPQATLPDLVEGAKAK